MRQEDDPNVRSECAKGANCAGGFSRETAVVQDRRRRDRGRQVVEGLGSLS